MFPAQIKDVPDAVSSAPKPKFDLERDLPYRLQFVSTASEAARLRAALDRLAVLRNAPEPNLDAEEEELLDFESGSIEPESTKAVVSPAKPEDMRNVLYSVETGARISFGMLNSLHYYDPYHEELLDEMFVDNTEYVLHSCQVVAEDDKKDELSLQSGVKSLKYNIPCSCLPNASDLSDLLTFLKSKKVIHDYTIDNNTILIDPFRGTEEIKNPPQSRQLITKDEKNNELFINSGVESIQYDIPSSSLSHTTDLIDLLTFLRSKKAIHNFIFDNNMISIETFNSHQQKLIGNLKVPESIPSSPSKPGKSGPLNNTVSTTYPKTQVVESQPSMSGSQKEQIDREFTKLSIEEENKSTDNPQLIEELDKCYPHKVYQYMCYPYSTKKVCTKDYCITCDPRYRRDRKTWLLHAKNRHYEREIIALYF